MTTADEACRRCGHPFGPHVLVATLLVHLEGRDDDGRYPAGGHLYCPRPECDCHSTWTVDPRLLAQAGLTETEARARIEPWDDVRAFAGRMHHWTVESS